MVLEDVADDAVPVKVVADRAERFLVDDLHVRDVIAVPDGRQQPVGEPHDEQVIDHLLAQVSVDAVERFLVPSLGQVAVERRRRHGVGSEGLLQHQTGPSPVHGPAPAVHRVRHRRVQLGRHGEVVEAVAARRVGILRLPTLAQVERRAKGFIRGGGGVVVDARAGVGGASRAGDDGREHARVPRAREEVHEAVLGARRVGVLAG